MKLKPIEIYADGSCLNNGEGGPGGYAAVIIQDGQKRTITGAVRASTNNRMEMMAALKGLESVRTNRPIIVYSDSQYLVKGMTSWVKSWSKRGWVKADGQPVVNKDLWIKLLAQCEGRSVKFEWVRGHSGQVDNELADRHAGRSSRSVVIDEGFENR